MKKKKYFLIIQLIDLLCVCILKGMSHHKNLFVLSLCVSYSFIAVFCCLTTYIYQVKRGRQTHTYFPLIVSVIMNTEHPGRGFGIAHRQKLNPAFAPHRGEERGQFVSSVSAFALRPLFKLQC